MTAMLGWARAYATRGWAVFPLQPKGKAPLGACAPNGCKDATTDLAQIEAWWALYPDANIGIATGSRSRLVVFDLDDKDDRCGSNRWAELVAAQGGDGSDGDPLEVATGSGGSHLVYSSRGPDGQELGITNRRGALPPGIDVRGEGGYIVAAPSLHPCGRRYAWVAGSLEKAPSSPPAWLVEIVRSDKLPDAPPVQLSVDGGYHTLTHEDLEAFVAFKSRYPDAAPLVLVARAVLDGTSWGKGERHTRMVAFLGALRTFVLDRHKAPLDPETSCELFDACTAAATEEGVRDTTDRHWIAGLMRALSADDAEYRGGLEAARERARAEKAAALPDGSKLDLDQLPETSTTSTPASRSKAQAGEGDAPTTPANEIEANIARAFADTDPGRTHPYTREELDAMQPTTKRWALITPAGYFLRAPGGDYIPVIEKAILTKARDVLAPAYTDNVFLKETNDKGELKLKPLALVLDQYGSAPTYAAYSYCVARSSLDGDTFVQRVGVPRLFNPEYNSQIAQWLELLAGDHHEALLDWLATFTRTDRPTAALCIMGTSGAGKDLAIEGLAELYGGARLSFERALHKFNTALTDSPIVVANEEIRTPREYSGNAADALKEMISDVKRKVEAKYGGAVDLHGCLRVILATNASGVLKFERQPTQSDIVALDERILLLRPTDACKAYLESLGGRTTTEAWVAGGGIARHVVWLQQTRQVTPGPRFLVQGRGGLSDLLSADGRGSAAVLRALLECLLGPKDKNLSVVNLWNGEIWASASRLKGVWATYGGRDDMPEDFGSAAENIFERGTSVNRKIDHDQIKMRRVKWPVLLRAAEREGRLEELLGLRG